MVLTMPETNLVSASGISVWIKVGRRLDEEQNADGYSTNLWIHSLWRSQRRPESHCGVRDARCSLSAWHHCTCPAAAVELRKPRDKMKQLPTSTEDKDKAKASKDRETVIQHHISCKVRPKFLVFRCKLRMTLLTPSRAHQSSASVIW